MKDLVINIALGMLIAIACLTFAFALERGVSALHYSVDKDNDLYWDAIEPPKYVPQGATCFRYTGSRAIVCFPPAN